MHADPTTSEAVSDEIPSDADPAVLDLYARTARHYDRLNAIVSFGTSNWYRRRTILSLDLPESATLLDVGCGTGVLAAAAQRYLPESPSIVAIDPCPEMRELARRSGVRDVRPGSFEDLSVEPASRDAVVSGYAIRYAQDLPRAFAGLRTVLRPGGRLVLLEMVVPRSRTGRRLLGILLRELGPTVLGIVCGSRAVRDLMRHFWDSISSFESPENVLRHLEEAGFKDVEYRPAGGLLGEFRATAPTD